MRECSVLPVPSPGAIWENRVAERIRNDAKFARWMAEEYKPIAGGWQY